MKATELIKLLKSNIKTYGDLDVKNIDDMDILYVEQCTEKNEDGEVAQWFEIA